jgi:chitinase
VRAATNVSPFSWEYPGKQGVGCNTISPDDSANFLLFLQELRKNSVGQSIKISAAVGIAPFVGSNGSPMTDVSDFAKVIDHIGKHRIVLSTHLI